MRFGDNGARMVWWRWFLRGLVAGLAVLAFTWRGTFGPGRLVSDLIARTDEASVRRPNPGTFRVEDVTIAGETLRALVAAQESRIAWDLVVPEHAWLEIRFGIEESVWETPGRATLFRAGLSSNGRYEEFVTEVVDPHANPADREWQAVRMDLSPFEGRAVSLIFNTAPAGGAPGGGGIWGDIRLMAR